MPDLVLEDRKSRNRLTGAEHMGDLGPADKLAPGVEVIVAQPPHLGVAECR
jgi:hypothetical protein